MFLFLTYMGVLGVQRLGNVDNKNSLHECNLLFMQRLMKQSCSVFDGYLPATKTHLRLLEFIKDLLLNMGHFIITIIYLKVS